MPRKFFRRFLPSHESVRANRYVARFGPWLQHHNLWHLHRRSVAGGIAAGLLAGLVPGSNPVQFTAGALLAIAFRVNLPLAVGVTIYSNPFTIVPLYYVAFKLGQLVLLESGGEPPAAAFGLADRNFTEWLSAALDWVVSLGKPLAIGLPLLAVLLAATGYLVTHWIWRLNVRCAWHRRRQLRAKHTA
jgi:uncharacterized protein (DUF2062 family)